MSDDDANRLGRHAFLAGTVLAVVAAAGSCSEHAGQKAADSGETLYMVLRPRDYDYRFMMSKLDSPNPHKQVFSATTIPSSGAAYAQLYAHMQFAINGYDLSLPPGRGKLATLGVVSGLAAVLSLNDAMWEKYNIGRHFGLPATNKYYRAKSPLDPRASMNDPNGLYQDWSAEAVLKRGGWFMACHNALAHIAATCSGGGRSGALAALADMVANLQPGFTLVPAGVTAVQLAQEYGWKLYTVV